MSPAGPFYAGIDGGQSATVAVVADAAGTVLGRGSAGGADEVGYPDGSRRTAAALEGALAAALAAAGLAPGTRLAAAVAGISGYEGGLRGVLPQLNAERMELCHDAIVAFAGALEPPGVMLLSGTGSVAHAQNLEGERATVGGWGYVFGDEGSSFWIARRGLSAAMAACDAGQRGRLYEAALRRFPVPDLRELARRFYAGAVDRAAIASFAPDVAHLANADPESAVIITDAALALARLAVHAASLVGLGRSFRVALVGGTFGDPGLRAATTAELVRQSREIAVVGPRAGPEIGALSLALASPG